jgi:hypothetical protein
MVNYFTNMYKTKATLNSDGQVFRPNLPVSLDCQFLIYPSVFSSVYLYDGLVHELFLLNYIIHSTMFESIYVF